MHTLPHRHPAHLFVLMGAIAAAMAAATAAPAFAQTPPSGLRVVQAQGDASINGKPASVGMAIDATVASVALQTGADGRLQLRTADGSLVALPPSSQSMLRQGGNDNTLKLTSGGLRLSPTTAAWLVDLADRSIRTNGYLKLQQCAAGCTLPPGLYGRVVQGEAVLEYQGGRSVLRSRSFRWVGSNVRPEVLAVQPALLDDGNNLADAARVRVDVARLLQTGVDAFRNNDDTAAARAFDQVAVLAPGEPLVAYYQGLLALKRQDNAEALRLLQQYAREDPDGAAGRDVPKMLTLLSSSQLQQEVASAVAREKDVVSSPPEPGSIAVQAFVNQGADAYRAMAKGLAAMVIADLSKVPGLKVLEREKVQLLVNEARLGDSGLTDTASAVRSGRLMRAEKVVVGNFEVQQ